MELARQGLGAVEALGVRRGYFEAVGGIENGIIVAAGELGWRIRENVSVFGRAQVDLKGYAVLGGVQVNF